MIYLLLAIASSAMVSISMRLSEGRVSGEVSMLVVNYLVCTAMAGIYMGFGNLITHEEGLAVAAGLGAVTGVFYLLCFVLLKLSIRRNGVVLSATFMKLGLLVPIVLSVGVLGEKPSFLQTVGFLLAVAAIILINFEREQTAMSFKLGLLLLILLGGGGDSMSKLFEEFGNPALSEHFLFYTFAAALLLCIGLMVVKNERPGLKDLFFGLLVGIPNYFSSRFLLKALGDLAAVIVYPTYSVATISVVTLTGMVFFREKLGRRQKIAIGIILVALILLNV